ncbi:MAG: hypothetical protein AB1Z57_10110 [Acidimicrobiia bacterium]
MTLAEALGPDVDLVRRHVPSVDPARVRLAALPDWCRRLAGIDPLAVTLGRLVLVSPELDRLPRCARVGLLAHEAAHVAQTSSSPLGFGVAYGVAYLVGRLAGRSHHAAYRNVPAEVLAREVQRRVLAECRGG